MLRSLRCTRGQAAVEVAALLPLAALLAAGVFHVLAAGAASSAAGAAAEAGAIALLQERDPRAAARASLAGWPRALTTVRVAGRRVSVTVRPRRAVGLLASALTARVTADAGASERSHPPARMRGGDGLGSAVR